MIAHACHCDLCGNGCADLYLFTRHGLCQRCYRQLYRVKIEADLFVAIVNAAKTSRRRQG